MICAGSAEENCDADSPENRRSYVRCPDQGLPAAHREQRGIRAGGRGTHTQPAALEGARAAGIPVIYVVHRGGPFAEYSPDVELHECVAPSEGERIITKTKPGPFSTTALDVNLREMGRDNLIVMGVATSGCVLSCVRWAVDVNYRFTVVADACSDGDPEVHRVLTVKVYPRQGTVISTDDFLAGVVKLNQSLWYW